MLQSRVERARPAEIRLRLIATLFGRASNVLMVALAAIVNAGAIYARHGGWPAVVLAVCEVSLLLVRSGVIVSFKKRRASETLSDPDPWLIRFGLLAIGSSMAWGAMCFVCLAYSHDPVLYVIPVLSTVGTAGAIAARNSGVPRLAKIQLATSLIPILAGCVFADDHGFRLLLLLVPAMAAGLVILIAERNQQLVELIETQVELARMSQTDALTRVANRRCLDARLEAMACGSAGTRQRYALLMVDVDHFKAFNDRHGHPAGDALLQQIASILRTHLRNPGDVVARYGGEEFMILLDGANASEASAVAEGLRQAVERTCRHPVGQEAVTVSVGVASGASALGPWALVKSADEALYRAKRAGRNRVAQVGAAEAALSH